MRLLMVGYGSIAMAHTRSFAHEGVELDAVYGRDPAKAAAFAREFGYARSVATLEEGLARDDIDLVAICSPSAVHATQAEAALRAGKHVLVEIPLAMSYAEAKALADLARATGKVLMVAHTQRYYRPLMEARRRVASGALTLHSIICRYAFLRRKNEDWQGRPRTWTDNLLWHHGCHVVDFALWMLGVTEPGSVEATGQLALPDQRMGIPMDLALTLRTPSDQLVSIAMSYNAHIPVHDYLMIGREDTLHYVNRGLVGSQGVIIGASDMRREGADGNLLQDQEFLAAVREGRPAALSAEAVLPAYRALQDIQDQYDARTPPGAVHPIAP
jgi:2-hydroxy-4-carboxymuconate semialdehyde hemiacetal dehydrogenase